MNSISVVLPLYSNSQKYVSRMSIIRRTLISLKNQIDISFEVIAVDNGSFDDTYTLFRQYFPKSLYLSFPESRQRAKARNLGVSLARNDNILFLDNDCFTYPTCIKNYKKLINLFPDTVIQGMFLQSQGLYLSGDEYIKVIDNKETIDYAKYESEIPLERSYRQEDLNSHTVEYYNSVELSYKDAYWDPALHLGNLLYPRHLINKLKGIDEDFIGWGHEDSMLGYVTHYSKIPVKLALNTIVIHQLHRTGNDLSHTEDCASELINRELLFKKVAALRQT